MGTDERVASKWTPQLMAVNAQSVVIGEYSTISIDAGPPIQDIESGVKTARSLMALPTGIVFWPIRQNTVLPGEKNYPTRNAIGALKILTFIALTQGVMRRRIRLRLRYD